jgi:hypothetical protein
MQTRTIRLAVPALAVITLAALATAASAAPPTPTTPTRPVPMTPAPRGVEIEITDTQTGKQPAVTRVVVPVTPGRDSSIKVLAEPTRTHVHTNVRAGQAGAWIVELRIDHAPNDLGVMGSAALRIGNREVFSTIDRPDGSKTEIAVTLR